MIKPSDIYWTLLQLKALRDSGIDVTMDDLFTVMEKGDHKLDASELVERAQTVALRRKKMAR